MVLAAELMISNVQIRPMQGKVIVAEVIHPGFRDPHLGMEG